MKKLFAVAMLAAFMAGGTPVVRANDMMMHKSPEEKQKHLNDKVEKMTKDLNLTPDQQATVRSAMQTKIEKIESAEMEAQNQIKAALNPDQTQKYNDMMKKKS